MAGNPQQLRITFHVPETFNDGSAVSSVFFSLLEYEILSVASGFTFWPAIGVWTGDAKTYRDPVRLYAVDIPAASSAIDDMARLGEWIKVELDQESVYITVTPIESLELPVLA